MIAAWTATEQSKQVCASSSLRCAFLEPDWLAANPVIVDRLLFLPPMPEKQAFRF